MSVDGVMTEESYNVPLQIDTKAVAWRLGYKVSRQINSGAYLFINADAKNSVILWL